LSLWFLEHCFDFRIAQGTPAEESLGVGKEKVCERMRVKLSLPGGKVFVAICVYFSVIFFALPTGILAGSTGIEHTAERILLDKAKKEEMQALLSSNEDSAPRFKCPQCSHEFTIN
jgi:hypothetical protein